MAAADGSELSERQRGIRDHFERVASRFGNTVHPYAARRRGEALSEHARGRILEVGCGSGAVTAYLVRKGKVVAGDIALGMARQTAERLGVTPVVFDGGVFPFGAETFDSVVCAEAIYYLRRPLDLVSEAYRVLRPKGVLAISCPSNFWQRVDRIRIHATRWGVQWGSRVPLSLELPWPDLLRGIRDAGFRLIRFNPVILLPFHSVHRINLLLEKSPLAALAIFRVVAAVKDR